MLSQLRTRYKMLSTKDDSNDTITTGTHEVPTEDEDDYRNNGNGTSKPHPLLRLLSPSTYPGALSFNLLAFALPALYGTLSKLWIAKIDASQVVTTDIYTYIGVVAEVLNEGLPRTAWLLIGDKTNRALSSRLSLSYTLIAIQTLLGLLMTLIFISTADRVAATWVPETVRASSLTYIRISSVQAISSALEVAVASSTRALDKPDVPLLISSSKFVVNIVLDLLLISRFHVGGFTPTTTIQALVRMSCDMTASLAGLLYFLLLSRKMQKPSPLDSHPFQPPRVSFASLKILARPGLSTFVESAFRNGLYLWLVSGIVAMGSDYATAWGVFNTIRWGMVMVPVQALEASSLAFVGHAWGRWRYRAGSETLKPCASFRDLKTIATPAVVSASLALLIEIPLCIGLSLGGVRGFAYYLSQAEPVALIAEKMWRVRHSILSPTNFPVTLLSTPC